jgi:hypothetical protein
MEKHPKWITPTLVVLSRSKPEEFSLSSCKYVGMGPVGPQSRYSGSCYVPGTIYSCPPCNSAGAT